MKEPSTSTSQPARLRVVHVAAYHRPDDGRVFDRECRSLAAAGYEVTLVTHHPPASSQDGVAFVDLGGHDPAEEVRQSIVRFVARIWLRTWRTVRRLRADVVHFHEPLLIPPMLVLKLTGRRVVYDVHEDAPRQAAGQARNIGRPGLAKLAAWGYRVMETLARVSFDRFVCATPTIAARFPPARTITVCNFPRLGTEINCPQPPYPQRPNHLIYIGYLFGGRGIVELIDVTKRLPTELQARLVLAGEFRPESFHQEARQRPGWANVDYLGWLDPLQQSEAMGKSRVGLVVLHPQPNYLDALPTKLFAYMAAGLPVVASDFPLWRRIIEDADCGLLVNPLDVDDIAQAVAYLLRHPGEAREMGERGRAAAAERYNWEAQEQKLLDLYADLAGRAASALPADSR